MKRKNVAILIGCIVVFAACIGTMYYGTRPHELTPDTAVAADTDDWVEHEFSNMTFSLPAGYEEYGTSNGQMFVKHDGDEVSYISVYSESYEYYGITKEEVVDGYVQLVEDNYNVTVQTTTLQGGIEYYVYEEELSDPATYFAAWDGPEGEAAYHAISVGVTDSSDMTALYFEMMSTGDASEEFRGLMASVKTYSVDPSEYDVEVSTDSDDIVIETGEEAEEVSEDTEGEAEMESLETEEIVEEETEAEDEAESEADSDELTENNTSSEVEEEE